MSAAAWKRFEVGGLSCSTSISTANIEEETLTMLDIVNAINKEKKHTKRILLHVIGKEASKKSEHKPNTNKKHLKTKQLQVDPTHAIAHLI